MNKGDPIIQMQDVSKGFGDIQALNKINLEIKRGEIIGLLGSNGAGKSTLIRHIIGLYLADQGECLTFGTDAAKLTPKELGRIGYVHQEGELLGWMTVKQLIRYVSTYYENWNHQLEEKYIHDFEISTKARVASLSPGQRQKVAILLAIGFEPELLILDEPAIALDPIARSQFLDLLLQIIQDEKRTIIISSHILSDVEKVIDQIMIMREGEILRHCSFDQLQEEFLKITLTSIDGELPAELPFTNIIACERNGSKAILIMQNCPQQELEAKAKALNCKFDSDSLPLEEIYKIIVTKQAGVK